MSLRASPLLIIMGQACSGIIGASNSFPETKLPTYITILMPFFYCRKKLLSDGF